MKKLDEGRRMKNRNMDKKWIKINKRKSLRMKKEYWKERKEMNKQENGIRKKRRGKTEWTVGKKEESVKED